MLGCTRSRMANGGERTPWLRRGVTHETSDDGGLCLVF